MTDDQDLLTERRLTALETKIEALPRTVQLQLGTLERRSEERHRATMDHLTALRSEISEAAEVSRAAAAKAAENQETLNRALWLVRQIRWIGPGAGAVWMWANGTLSWPELKALLRSLGG